MDERLTRLTTGWSCWEIYGGKKVIVPDCSTLYDFEFLPTDRPDDSEKQVYLALGWRDYDVEAIVALGLFGQAALDSSVQQVSVEVTRLGGAELHVLKDGKELVWFPAYNPLKKTQLGYAVFTLTSPVG